MGRIHLFEKRERFQSRGIVISIAVFAVLILLFVSMLTQAQSKSAGQETRVLEDALQRAVILCYAIEGRYPPSAEYLVENYGVAYDEEKYIISYHAFASNIMPNYQVLVKGATGQ